MPDRDGPRSNPYKPNPAKCCEACVFGRGEHADWCATRTMARRQPGLEELAYRQSALGLFEALFGFAIFGPGL
jgi:hypothetical protein